MLADNVNQTTAQDLAIWLYNALIQPIQVDGRELIIRASFGIASSLVQVLPLPTSSVLLHGALG